MRKKVIVQVILIIFALVPIAIVMLPIQTANGIGPIPPLW